MRAYDEYGAIARWYDPFTAGLLRGVRRGIVRHLRGVGARRVLDVCCGTGWQLRMLHEAGFVGAGVDLSSAMLGVARRACPPQVALVRGDAALLPFEDAAFDAVVVCFALHEKEQAVRLAMLGECVRVLARGGCFLVADHLAEVAGPVAHAARHAAALVERAAGARHFALYGDFVRRDGVPGLARESGLVCLPVETLAFGAAGLFRIVPAP
ncbi:demethylmenaquinone methyltransferase/2-methoxy-6-polyprenyl-1,4-benzoquinol methylase [Desulfobaculum xiamenense]|uniref:Demethylmenaquinone methyltransferase/2-methoxy-6-polyprenyl-1,4-benzoquinol methylase n=1 Tax=Desulfobaculum xiamenense TaxID=995050 RepID=A0A846QWM8_9BACT|nr:class I SAM-dependent methyltransferase [Desulfobaculum xiamenense]NJB69019.1 demethylmenaquinone methyltransferase/2-methoxy-6-polyprenyl-1,4-benzoquinol methylase [Desulfobaculum xiamenense]